MASWQFDVAVSRRGAPHPTITDDGYQLEPLPELLIARAKKYLAAHLGQAWEMLPGWLVFGQEDGNRFDVVEEEDGFGSISARIDARVPSNIFLLKVSELAQTISCVLYVPEGEIYIEPARSELEQALSKSSAAKFVRDPNAFLRGLV
jgi:hypothetical protein